MARVVGVSFLLFVAVVTFVFLHKHTRVVKTEIDSEKCLQNPDCRNRLEAAVNEVYSESGYKSIYIAP